MDVSKDFSAKVAKEIESAVQVILEKNRLEAGKVRIKYGDVFSFSIEASRVTLNENGVNTSTPEAQMWKIVGEGLGFDKAEDALGAHFEVNGNEYKFLGWNDRSKRFPVIAYKEASGEKVGFSARVLRRIEGYSEDKVEVAKRNWVEEGK